RNIRVKGGLRHHPPRRNTRLEMEFPHDARDHSGHRRPFVVWRWRAQGWPRCGQALDTNRDPGPVPSHLNRTRWQQLRPLTHWIGHAEMRRRMRLIANQPKSQKRLGFILMLYRDVYIPLLLIDIELGLIRQERNLQRGWNAHLGIGRIDA